MQVIQNDTIAKGHSVHSTRDIIVMNDIDTITNIKDVNIISCAAVQGIIA